MNCSEDMIEAANERIQTMFAETAILLTHPVEARRALAKERIYAILFATTIGNFLAENDYEERGANEWFPPAIP
jgi:hypothetical protein